MHLRWISSLGKDVMASKAPVAEVILCHRSMCIQTEERLNSLDSIAEQHSTSLLAHEAEAVKVHPANRDALPK